MLLGATLIATLGSIMDSQPSWESCKFYLARWSHEVALFLSNPDHHKGYATNPPPKHIGFETDPPYQQLMFKILFCVPTPVRTCDQIWCVVSPLLSFCSESMCGVPPSRYTFFQCGVPPFEVENARLKLVLDLKLNFLENQNFMYKLLFPMKIGPRD